MMIGDIDCSDPGGKQQDAYTGKRPSNMQQENSYGSAEGPPHGVENRNLLSHPDDLRMEVYVIRMT